MFVYLDTWMHWPRSWWSLRWMIWICQCMVFSPTKKGLGSDSIRILCARLIPSGSCEAVEAALEQAVNESAAPEAPWGWCNCDQSSLGATDSCQQCWVDSTIIPLMHPKWSLFVWGNCLKSFRSINGQSPMHSKSGNIRSRNGCSSIQDVYNPSRHSHGSTALYTLFNGTEWSS